MAACKKGRDGRDGAGSFVALHMIALGLMFAAAQLANYRQIGLTGTFRYTQDTTLPPGWELGRDEETGAVSPYAYIHTTDAHKVSGCQLYAHKGNSAGSARTLTTCHERNTTLVSFICELASPGDTDVLH